VIIDEQEEFTEIGTGMPWIRTGTSAISAGGMYRLPRTVKLGMRCGIRFWVLLAAES
jgi:hypothetical protein